MNVHSRGRFSLLLARQSQTLRDRSGVTLILTSARLVLLIARRIVGNGVPSPPSDRYSGPSTPLVDDLVFAFDSAPQGPPAAVARANSEEDTGWAESFAITSMGVGSESGLAVEELGDPTSAVGVLPICIGWDSGCGIKPALAGELTDKSGVLPD
jgi:hypothetical protein